MSLVWVLRVAAALVLGLTVLVVAAHILWSAAIGREIDRLKADARAPADPIITAERIAGLPAPAIRYFTRAGVVGTAIPRLVRLTQKGRIRSSASAGWMPLEAEEYYSTSPPGFVWRAAMPGFGLPVVLGRDAYVNGAGSIDMRLLSLIPVAREDGEALRAAALMRYLNEAMWFPAALLGDNVTITAIDESRFGVRIGDRGLTAEATISIDPDGRLTNFRAVRYNTATRRDETWETPISSWSRFGAHELPNFGAADWKLADGDLRYIELEITAVEYLP